MMREEQYQIQITENNLEMLVTLYVLYITYKGGISPHRKSMPDELKI